MPTSTLTLESSMETVKELNKYLDTTVHAYCDYNVYSDLKDIVFELESENESLCNKAREIERKRIEFEILEYFKFRPNSSVPIYDRMSTNTVLNELLYFVTHPKD